MISFSEQGVISRKELKFYEGRLVRNLEGEILCKHATIIELSEIMDIMILRLTN